MKKAAKNPTAAKAEATPRADVNQILTERIISLLEAGTIPWKKPWTAFGAPRNYASGHVYQGINALYLASFGFEVPLFLTYKQAAELGGQVRKGSTGLMVVYAGQGRKEDKETQETKRFSFLRYSTVFNIEQIDGIEWKLPEQRVHQAHEAAEQVSDRYRADGGPRLVFEGDEAVYFKSRDLVRMPRPEAFHSPEEYYATLFHEYGHSTGHLRRLNRADLVEGAGFGTPTYAREELTAEMCAAFLSGAVGLDISSTLTNTAAYIQSWLGALRNDKTLLVRAAAQAQRAANLILGIKPAEDAEGQPAG